MSKIANAFKDGDAVMVKPDTETPSGDRRPQAGKRGIIIRSPKPGRYTVDVPGMPVVNLPAEDLEPAAQAAASSTPSPAAASGAMHADKRPVPGTVTYAFDVLPLSLIVPSLTNPRSYFEPEALQSLSDNIKSDGLLQPILVRPLPGARLQETFSDRRSSDPRPTHEIVAGERRFRACGMAGVRSVPVLVRILSDEQVLRMQLVENVQREDLHPLEEAQGYRRILDLPSQAERTMAARVADMAASVKKSTRYIYQTLQLLDLCSFAKEVFLSGNLQRTIALQIATIGNEAGQIEATKKIAGITRSGSSWQVVNDPMSQREAARYVHDNFRLLLSKARFPIKVEFAGQVACTSCPKMSSNARDLFDEGAKMADTCLDSSCYGKKNVAHDTAIAEAAKAKGQKVITGAAAKKIIPYDGHEDDDSLEGGYVALNERQYGPGLNGKTVKELLGKDIPLPVLIQNPHAPGFIEALAEADLQRIYKERGLLTAPKQGTTDYKEQQRIQDKKDKAEKAWRWAWGEALLERADNVDDVELLEDLLIPVAVQAYRRLDNECTKRTHKLMKWDFSPIGFNEKAKLTKHFVALPPGELNKFLICVCVTSELHVAQYYKPSTAGLETMGEILQVDGKAIKTKLQAEAKAVEKAKADKAKAKLKPAAKAPAAAPSGKLAIDQRVRFKDGVKGHGGKTRKCAGKAGVIAKFNGQQYTVKLDGVADTVQAAPDELEALPDPKPSNKTQWRAIATTDVLQDGMEVRITSDKAKLHINQGTYAGAVGKLGKTDGDKSRWVTVREGNRQSSMVFHLYQLQLRAEEPAAPAADKPTKAGKNKPADPNSKQAALDLPATSAMAAWPFPKEGRP
jgi:ParB/RepB/Spo0J family partition protein